MQRPQPDVLDRDNLVVDGGLLAPPGGPPDVHPIGCFVASAAMPRRLYEGLEQHRAIAVAQLPILGKLASHLGQDLRGQAFGLNPGQDEEARVVDHELQILQPLWFWLGACRAWGRACVEAENGLSLGAMHSHARRHGAQWQRRISPFSASTRRAGASFGAIRCCRLVVGGSPTPRRRLGLPLCRINCWTNFPAWRTVSNASTKPDQANTVTAGID